MTLIIIRQHLCNKESEVLKLLTKKCILVIQKAHKGNSVVLIENNVYLRYM